MVTTADRSRQIVYQVWHKAEGLCLRCPEPVVPGSVSCLYHLNRDRMKHRVRTHSRPWRAGRRGRPPLLREGGK